MNNKRSIHLYESLKRIEQNTFDERDVKLLLIELRDLLTIESFLREVCDFVAHPKRERGICHITINSRYGKMKFNDEGVKRLLDEGIFAKNPNEPWSFFSNQILDYIDTPRIKKDIFEIIIKEGIEEIPDHLFQQSYHFNKHKAKTIIFSSYLKDNGYYVLKPTVIDKEYTLLDDLLKFVRGTITGTSAFRDIDLKNDLCSGIARILSDQNITLNLETIKEQLDSIVICIISILHDTTFKMFDGTEAIAYITVNKIKPANPKSDLSIDLNVQTPNFSFPIVSTSLNANKFIDTAGKDLTQYESRPIPWNYAARDQCMKLVLMENGLNS